MSKKYIPASGPIGAKIMIVCANPTYNDLEQGHFTSKSYELDTMLKMAGIHKDNCWISAVSKYYVPPNIGKKKTPFHIRAREAGIDLDEQIRDLHEEIHQIKPNVIIGLGKGPLWALTSKYDITSYRGSIMSGGGRKFIPTYNPDHLSWHATDVEFKGYYNRQIMIFDLKRAFAQSRFPEIILPQRTLQICENPVQLLHFRDQYRKTHKKMGTDIEAHRTYLPAMIGFAFTRKHGMTVPLWNRDGLSYMSDSQIVECWIIVQEMLQEFGIIGQNFNYDRDKLYRLGFTIRHLAEDTLLKAKACNPELPGGLAFNTSIYTEEPFYKNEGMYQGSAKDLMIGCARDSCVTVEVSEEQEKDLIDLGQSEFYHNFMMKLPDMYWKIEKQGFRVDIAERNKLLQKYIEWDERLRYELYKLAGRPVNVNSPKDIPEILFNQFKLPHKESTGEEAITELLNSPKVTDEIHRQFLEKVLEDRRVRKTVSTYLGAMPDYDGRMRTTYFLCLETGRTSTGQQGEPIRPIVEVRDEKNIKKKKEMGIAFQTMTKHGDIGADVRGMYVPDASHIEIISDYKQVIEEEEVFIQADSSQAEARVVWLLADDEDALTLVDTIDYHALTASWFFGGTEKDYSKKELGYEHPIRFVGKTLRHAGHLGAGPNRAAISVNTDARKFKIPITITKLIAENSLKIFHAKQPKIQQVFQTKVAEAIQKSRRLVAAIPYGMDCSTGGKRTFFERTGEELNRQAFSYIPQRTVSDNTKAAGIRIRNRIPNIKIVMEAHDSLLFSVPISKKISYGSIIKEEFERPISFANCSIPRRDLIIPCELEIGHNYKDLAKFKDLPFMPPSHTIELETRELTADERKQQIAGDSKRDEQLYYHIVEKKQKSKWYV